jgi:hypothetical protein
VSKELALFVLKLNLGQDEMPFKEFVIIKGGDIIEVNMHISAG